MRVQLEKQETIPPYHMYYIISYVMFSDEEQFGKCFPINPPLMQPSYVLLGDDCVSARPTEALADVQVHIVKPHAGNNHRQA